MNNLAEKYEKILICQHILPKKYQGREEEIFVPDILSCEKVRAFLKLEAWFFLTLSFWQ